MQEPWYYTDFSTAQMYVPLSRFWPEVDDALRRAAYNRGVHVRFLGSCWNHTSPDMIKFLRSLADITLTGDKNGTIQAVSR